MGPAVDDLLHFAFCVDGEKMNSLEFVPDLMKDGIGSGRHTADDTADLIVTDILTNGLVGVVGVEKLHCSTALAGYVEEMLNGLRVGRVAAVLNIEHTEVSTDDISDHSTAMD